MNFHLEQMENLFFLGVPIHKHIRVIVDEISTFFDEISTDCRKLYDRYFPLPKEKQI